MYYKYMIIDDVAGVCKGFIRVIMNLSRPINVLPGTRLPSVLNLTQDSLTSERTLTSFYLPHETEKILCVNSSTTTRDVIRSLLSKFRIVDNPHKYVLYEKRPFSSGRRRSSSSSTVTISGRQRKKSHQPSWTSWTLRNILEHSETRSV